MLCAKAEDNRAVAEKFAEGFSNYWLIEATEEKIVVKYPKMETNAAQISFALHAATELAKRLESALAR